MCDTAIVQIVSKFLLKKDALSIEEKMIRPMLTVERGELVSRCIVEPSKKYKEDFLRGTSFAGRKMELRFKQNCITFTIECQLTDAKFALKTLEDLGWVVGHDLVVEVLAIGTVPAELRDKGPFQVTLQQAIVIWHGMAASSLEVASR